MLRAALVGLLLGGIVRGGVPAEEQAQPADAAAIRKLIERLGHDKYAVRQAAQKKLIEMGEAAEAALREALGSNDLETRSRAESALTVILARAFQRRSEAARNRLLWRSQFKGAVPYRVFAESGVVLACHRDGRLTAIRAKTGKRVWLYRGGKRGPPGRGGGPAVAAAAKTVYISGPNGYLQALDTATGKPRPQFKPRGVLGEVTIANGVLYLGSLGGKLLAWDARTGEPLWEIVLPGRVAGWCSPVVAEGRAYCLTRDGKLLALDLKTRRQVWQAGGLKGAAEWLTRRGNLVILQMGDVLRAFDEKTGRAVWKRSLESGAGGDAGIILALARAMRADRAGARPDATWQPRPFVISEGTIYVEWGGSIHAVDLKVGQTRWQFRPKTTEKPQDRAAVAEDVVVLGRGVGAARVVVELNGALRLAGAQDLTPPVVCSGVMYLGSSKGLHAVDLRARREIWRLSTDQPVGGPMVLKGDTLYFYTGAAAAAEVDELPLGARITRPAVPKSEAVMTLNALALTPKSAVKK